MYREPVTIVRSLHRLLWVMALMAMGVAWSGCGGGGDEEAEAEPPKTALVPGALDDTLHTTADTSSWYQMGGTESDDSGLSHSTGHDVEALQEEPAQEPHSQARPNPSSASPKPEGDFILQLGSFRDEDNARRQAALLREKGHSPSIEVSNLGGQIYHRVVLLGLPDHSAASALGERIHAELGITYLVRRAR